MAKPHGHCDGFSCDECNAADDAATRAEENTAATFAALVEVARAADVVHHLRLRFALAKNVSEQRIILNQMNVAWNRYADAAARLSALNPKLLEDGR